MHLGKGFGNVNAGEEVKKLFKGETIIKTQER
jgi:hypothetical protein